MAKRQKAESIHDRDRIIVRLPAGMRDKIAAMALANGRSMTAEVIAALDQHLQGADRITQLWETFEKHRANIEAIGLIWDAVDHLEYTVRRLTGDDFRGVLNRARDEEREAARQAKLPPITAEQVATIRNLINESGKDEAWLLKVLAVASIEEIKDFEKAETILERWRVHKTVL